MAVANTLAYYKRAAITAKKYFFVPGQKNALPYLSVASETNKKLHNITALIGEIVISLSVLYSPLQGSTLVVGSWPYPQIVD
jgi:hypothetical protein